MNAICYIHISVSVDLIIAELVVDLKKNVSFISAFSQTLRNPCLSRKDTIVLSRKC